MNSKKTSDGNFSSFIFGLIFGFIFFLGGILVAYSTIGTMTIKYFSSINWVSVPANISVLNLNKKYGSDFTRYLVKASYSYSYNGERQSSSVTFDDSHDNLGNYWQELYKKLKQDKSNGRAKVWVNPDNPDQALLDRTFRWTKAALGLISILIFCSLGFYFMWLSIKTLRSDEEESKDQRSSRIRSEDNMMRWVVLLVCSGFFGMCLFLSLMALSEAMKSGKYVILLFALVPIFGAYFFACLMWGAFIQGRSDKLRNNRK